MTAGTEGGRDALAKVSVALSLAECVNGRNLIIEAVPDYADIKGGVRVGEGEPAANEILLHLAGGSRHLDDARLQLRDGGNVTRQHAEHAIRAGDDHLQAS